MTSLALAFDILARDKASSEFDKVGDAADRAGTKGGHFGVVAGAALAGVAIAAGKFAKDSIAAFKESEDASARLDDALKRFPATNDVTRASFDDLNAALAKKTVFDDDATASGQAVLAQFKLTGTEIQQLTPLLQDYAAKTGKDLPEAADVLGKALLGKGKALAEVGVKFKDAGSVEANYTQITEKLRTQVGGFAEQEGKTAAGQAQILSNQFGEVQETVGSKLVPILTTLTGKLLEVIDFVQRNSDVIKPLVLVVGSAAAAYIAVEKAIALTNAVMAIFRVGAAETGVATTVALGPIGLIIIAIAALAAGLIYAYKHSETFRDVVQAVFKTVGNAVLTLVDLWLGAWQKMFQAMSHIPIIGDKFGKVADAIGKARDKVDDLRDSLNKVPEVKKIRVDLAVNGINTLAGVTSKLDRLDGARALGGAVRAGGSYLVGERGPEILTMPAGSGGYITPNGQRPGGDTHIHVTAPTNSPSDVAAATVLALRMA